jgi:hypothetical protein
MSETKTYVFGENGNANNSLDPNLLWASMNNGGFGGGNGSWLWALFLLFLFGNGNGFGNGFGGNGGRGVGYLSDQLNNTAGRDLLMQAIQGNSSAIDRLSSSLGCSIGDIQTALNGLGLQISNVGNQVGMSSMQVINAIQQGNCQLANQIAQCCCDTRAAIANVNVGMERGFSSVAYETQRQTCDIEKAISNSTSQILEGQRAAEMREMQNKLDALREKNAQQAVILNNAQQTAQFSAMLAPIQADLAELKCNQVPVKKIACTEQYIPVNTGINATYGLIPNGCGFGGYPFGWNNGSLWG